MSRVETKTDNPIIEAVNVWVKGELYIDVKIRKHPNILEGINQYIEYFNHERPA